MREQDVERRIVAADIDESLFVSRIDVYQHRDAKLRGERHQFSKHLVVGARLKPDHEVDFADTVVVAVAQPGPREVDDALDLIDRLAKSARVRQSIIRHAFRYFMGRNETLNDSRTLINADRAYLESGGSFDELIVSLLTSDSFIYRKAPDSQTKN